MDTAPSIDFIVGNGQLEMKLNLNIRFSLSSL